MELQRAARSRPQSDGGTGIRRIEGNQTRSRLQPESARARRRHGGADTGTAAVSFIFGDDVSHCGSVIDLSLGTGSCGEALLAGAFVPGVVYLEQGHR